MSFNSLDKLLQVILSQPQWEKQRRYYELKKCWYEIANHKVTQHTRPVSVKNDTLYVATSNAVWAQELSLQRRGLIVKINRRTEKPIKDLHFASMSWYNNHLVTINMEDDTRQEKHPSLIADSGVNSSSLEKSETPTEALEKWFEQIKNRTSTWHSCPNCHTSCPEGELKRWGVCAICFRDNLP